MGKRMEFPPSVLDLNIDYENAVIGITFIRHFVRLRQSPDDDAPKLTDDFDYNKNVVARDLWPELNAYRELPDDALRFISYCSAITGAGRKWKCKRPWVEIAEEQFRIICQNERREVPLFLVGVDPRPELTREMVRQANRHAWWSLDLRAEAESAS